MSHIVLALLILFSDMGNREDMKFAFSAEQGTDLSCGFSVLATFLTGYWGLPSDETFLVGKYGSTGIVSVRNLLLVLTGEGFAAQAFRMDFAQLKKALGLYAPVIVHMDRPEGHFALLLEIRDDVAVLSDPALGTMFSTRSDFLASWSGAAIVARPLGKEVLPGEFRRVNAGLLAAAARSAWGRYEGMSDSFKFDRFRRRLP